MKITLTVSLLLSLGLIFAAMLPISSQASKMKDSKKSPIRHMKVEDKKESSANQGAPTDEKYEDDYEEDEDYDDDSDDNEDGEEEEDYYKDEDYDEDEDEDYDEDEDDYKDNMEDEYNARHGL